MPMLNRLKKNSEILIDLIKIKITFFSSLTALTGILVAQKKLDVYSFLLIIGIFFIAAASAALNHLQEIKTDALMPRTRNRPLPTKRINKKNVILLIGILITIGSCIIIYSSNLIAVGLTLFTLVVYNFMYTPLKLKTPLSILVGAIVGMFPPLIGWSAVFPNEFPNLQVIILAVFFFIGQIPHTLFIFLKYREEYLNAKFPLLINNLSPLQIKNVLFVWIFSCGMIALLFPVIGIVQSYWAMTLSLLFILSFMTYFFIHLYIKNDLIKNVKMQFVRINLFFLSIILVIIFDAIAY